MPLHQGYESGRDCQPQPEAGDITRIVEPFESSEYPFFLLKAYSHTRIQDRNMKISRPVFHLKKHLPVKCELQGIGQQVADYLPDMRAVTVDHNIQTGERCGERKFFLPGGKTVAVRYFFKQSFQAEECVFGVRPTFIHPVIFHQRVYQSEHIIGRMQDIAQITGSATTIAFQR